MATYSSPLYTAQAAGLLNGGDRPTARDYGGSLHTLRTIYPLSSGTEETETDIINIGYLPKGATVIPGLCFVDCEVPGTDLTLDIGTAADPDGLADGIVLDAGGHVAFTSSALPAQSLVPVTTTDETLVYATVSVATALTDASKLSFVIVYELYS